MQNVKEAALDRAPKLERAKKELHYRSAVSIQRISRGILCRNNKHLRRVLARMHGLRKREKALAEKEAAIAAQELEVERNKNTCNELLRSAADLQRIEMTINKRGNNTDAQPTVESPNPSNSMVQHSSSQGSPVPASHGRQPSSDRTNFIERMLNDDISAIQDADDDGSLLDLDTHSHHSNSSSISQVRLEAMKVSRDVISVAAQELHLLKKPITVDRASGRNTDSTPITANINKSTDVSVTLNSQRGAFGPMAPNESSSSALTEPASTKTLVSQKPHGNVPTSHETNPDSKRPGRYPQE